MCEGEKKKKKRKKRREARERKSEPRTERKVCLLSAGKKRRESGQQFGSYPLSKGFPHILINPALPCALFVGPRDFSYRHGRRLQLINDELPLQKPCRTVLITGQDADAQTLLQSIGMHSPCCREIARTVAVQTGRKTWPIMQLKGGKTSRLGILRKAMDLAVLHS
ncbi:hypothetical protein CPSG_09492 [Coccidioides posadasii str. Silveira]|uniref:Uncharacterized protein n=1 Tax=Coccidioides posadasii (strain RMSCC 757 / Silveira) TaxID=443226 RepID=E9DI43_COCPS|nr:hypothetical protein CPSG_09492 [Coccidioides posadasii str. Silveira]